MRSACPYTHHLFYPIWLIFLFSFFPVFFFAQNIQFERIPNELGLSQNFTSAFCQDKKGFIWVGTKDGLNRFDGYTFKIFTNDAFDSLSISSNYIYSLLEDSAGRLWVGTEKGLNLYDPKTESFIRMKSIKRGGSGNSIQDMSITCITEDSYHNIWVGTQREGVVKIVLPKDDLNLEHASFTFFGNSMLNDGPVENPGIRQLIAGEKGEIWINFRVDITIIRWDPSTKTHQFIDLDWADILKEEWIPKELRGVLSEGYGEQIDVWPFFLFSARNNSIWIKTDAGFGQWNYAQDYFDFKALDFDPQKHYESPTYWTQEIDFEDADGKFWIGNGYRLVVYNPATHEVEYQQYFWKKIEDSDNFYIRGLLQDNAGNLWARTTGFGLYKFAPNKHRFRGKNGTGHIHDKSILSIHETSDGTVLIQDYDFQTYLLNRKTGTGIKKSEKQESKYLRTYNLIHAVHEDSRGEIWFGGPQNSLLKYVIKDESLKLLKMFPASTTPLEVIYDLDEDDLGRLWVLTNARFGTFDPETEIFNWKPYLKNKEAFAAHSGSPVIHQGADGIFWLGTNEGLKRYDARRDTFISYINDPKDRSSISLDMVKTICPDPEKPEEVLWIGTGGGGLNRFDIATKTFTHFKKEDGLPDNVVYGILSDEQGFLWISTNQGLSRFDPSSKTFLNFTKADGLQDNEFNSGAYFKSPSGELFFGGIGGVTSFFPEDIKESDFMPPVVITDFFLANKKVDFKSLDAPLSKPILETEELVLSHLDKIFSFEFAALDFTDPEKNKYAYRLLNFDDEWQYIGHQRNATFTNISPGTYTFQVKGSNHDGIWNENYTSLEVIILPPWWQTWWAYLSYVLVFAIALFSFYRFKLKQELERAETNRIKELDKLKTRLYTNITHEFRTPLTVIMGMSEQIVGQENIRTLIRRNTKNLLRLINQLLDLSKLDSGTIKMDHIQGDIINYLEYLTESFHSMAYERKIRLSFYSEIQELIMDFDEVKIQHIVYNLLSNALKFTPEGGKVTMHTNQKERNGQLFLNLKVSDTGIGIAADRIPHIFDRFYQVDNSTTRKAEGTGIGLALTKELVELMHGTISVESSPGKGTVFSIFLPVKLEAETTVLQEKFQTTVALSPDLVPSQVSKDPVVSSTNSEKPILLIIEDNRDVTSYIVNLLEKDYEIQTAANGQLGIDKALEIIPDIIISDVMMPEKDGYEVCETLKNDARTNHIPIILLTAKATAEDKLTGLKTGADAYLMKPFNKDELLVRLNNLLTIRKKLQDKYAMQMVPVSGAKIQKTDLTETDLFLQKLQQIVLEKLDDPKLGAEDLCQAVKLSQSQLYRKMNALLNQTPNAFIRKIRLHRAMEMLKTTKLNVSEIAYDVGFNDPAYFSRAFHKEFGKSPSYFVSD